MRFISAMLLLSLLAACAAAPSGKPPRAAPPAAPKIWTAAARRAAAATLAADLIARADRISRRRLEAVATVLPILDRVRLKVAFEPMVEHFVDRVQASGRVRVADEGFNVIITGQHIDVGRIASPGSGRPAHHAIVLRAVDLTSEELLWIGVQQIRQAPAGNLPGASTSSTSLVSGAGLVQIAADVGAALAAALSSEETPLVVQLKGVTGFGQTAVQAEFLSALIERRLYERLGPDSRHQLMAGGRAGHSARHGRRRAALEPNKRKDLPLPRLEATALLSGELKPTRSAGDRRFELSLSLVHLQEQRTLWTKRVRSKK